MATWPSDQYNFSLLNSFIETQFSISGLIFTLLFTCPNAVLVSFFCYSYPFQTKLSLLHIKNALTVLDCSRMKPQQKKCNIPFKLLHSRQFAWNKMHQCQADISKQCICQVRKSAIDVNAEEEFCAPCKTFRRLL